jgi:DNA repair protein RecN (Recombination protein N)
MLAHLHIRNLAVLAEASVDFREGFNVLTGETGAGKSIVVDSLSLLAGARASADLIRTGADNLTVTGVFEGLAPEAREILAAAGIDTGADDLVVRREINRAGRNRVYLNDQPATLRLLADVAPWLLRIHGQREELGLAQPELQRTWLDRQGGEQGEVLTERVAAGYRAYRELADRLERVTGNDRIRQERIDLLTYQIGEIEQAALAEDEDTSLRSEREQLRHGEQIAQALGAVVDDLLEADGSVAETLAHLHDGLTQIEAWQPRAGEWREEIDELRIRAQELARTVAGSRSDTAADPSRLAEIEDRLSTVERLGRKYGPSCREVLERCRSLRAELDELELDAEDRDQLTAEAETALAEYRDAALELSASRAAWGRTLAERVRGELTELALAEAVLEVRTERRARAASPLVAEGESIDFGTSGIDQVTFLFAPNPGEEPRPLARIASGGELSRVYLALQLLARTERGHRATLVFDEVDSGVGGVEAVLLGRKLQTLAAGGQILSVTHLPQVASRGDHHFQVTKSVADERTQVAVVPLESAERIREIARMLGGEEAAAASLAHAEEMLAEAGA